MLTRIGGLASGMDTNQMVKDLMRVERMRAVRFQHQRQIISWQKEQYRSVINNVRSFRDRFFDVLRPETNLTSAQTLRQLAVSTSNPAQVTVTAGSGAQTGETTFRVIQSAAAARAQNSGVTSIQGSAAISAVTVSEGKNSLSFTLNGQTQSITIPAGTYETGALRTALQGQLDQAFGPGRILAASPEGRLSFSPDPLSITAASDTLAVSSSTYFDALGNIDSADLLAAISIPSGTNNRLNPSDSMGAISQKLKNGPLHFDAAGTFVLSINGREITVNRTDTLGAVLNNINNSGAGVRAAYSSFSDTFTITAARTGAGQTAITGGNFVSAFGLSGEAGRDAIFEINNVLATRAANTFTVDDLTYTINNRVDAADNAAPVTINTTLDTDAIYNTIVKFVEDYNTLIALINSKLREERFRDFPPLTDEQKEALSEKEIERWEQKAQSGLLRNDANLQKMAMDLRRAIFDSVGGVQLAELGIETSRNWQDNGKLVLPGGGAVLRQAISQDPDRVADFFTRRSGFAYTDWSDRRQRYAESGLGQRLSDILNDNIRSTRDNQGQKGILLEKAGIEGDSTHTNNLLSRRLQEADSNISRVESILIRREEQLFRQFAAMEEALQELYAQGEWLAGQLNRGQ